MKYPTFTPPAVPVEVHIPDPVPVVTAKLAQAYSPIPVRHHYDHDEVDVHQSNIGQNPQVAWHNAQAGSSFRPIPQPATPAPTPPQSPKPKKQHFSTDQNRPFLFPFSRSQIGYRNARLVPHAIDEADKLYAKHMYVSLALWQMWKTREECMIAESGLDHMPGAEKIIDPLLPPTVSGPSVTRISELIGTPGGTSG